MPTFERTFTGGIEQIPAIRQFVVDSAEAMQFSPEDVFACELVVDEAATNAFRHSYAGQPGRVEVKVWRETEDAVLSVRNWGTPFDPAAVPQPDIHKPLEERAPGGLGLFLMRRFTDEVRFEFDPLQGNTIVMRRRLDQPEDLRQGAS